MKITVTMLLFILEIWKYQKAYYICFSKKINKIWIPCVTGIILYMLFVLNPSISSSGRHSIAYIFALVTLFLMMQEKWKERLVNLAETFFLLICMDEIVNLPVKLLRVYTGTDNPLEHGDSLIVSLVSLFILYGIILLKKKKKNLGKKVWNVLNEKMHYLVIMMIIEMLVTVSGLNYAKKYVSNLQFTIITVFLCVISYISIGTLGIFVLYIKRMNQKIEEMLQREVWFKNMQKFYYEELLEREEDTRKYRHDMINHLICLESFAGQQDIQALKEYLHKMQEQVSKIQRKCYNTGNQVLDIVSNYYLNMVGDETDVRMTGRADEKLAIDNMLLCTVYGNLLKNAVEELLREDNPQAFLHIAFLQGEEYFQMTLQNSLSEISRRKKDILLSGKEDKQNHGIGLHNVRKAVEDWGGKTDIRIDEKSFTAEVILRQK